MKSARRRRQILAIVETDNTFERAELRGAPVFVGKCIHCNARVVIADSGEPLGPATIEHIVPRAHGGTDAPQNLALACARCNWEKGRRHDSRGKDDARRIELVARLQRLRRERWRERE